MNRIKEVKTSRDNAMQAHMTVLKNNNNWTKETYGSDRLDMRQEKEKLEFAAQRLRGMLGRRS